MNSNADSLPDSEPLDGQSKHLIPPTERLKFILLFSLLTGLSLFIGIGFANSLYNPLRGRITGIGFEEGLIWGAIVGAAQWLILRKYSFDRNWIFVTALGCAISMTLAYILTLELNVTGSSGNVFIVLWIGFSAQSIALNHYAKRSWLWILVSLLPAFIAASLWAALIPINLVAADFSSYGFKLLVVKLSQGLILGFIPALGLCLFYKKNHWKSPVGPKGHVYTLGILPRKLGRVRYFCYHLILVGVFIGVIYPLIGPNVFNIGVLGFKLLVLDVPRSRSIGWSPWIVLLMFIPVVNALIQLLLLGLPANFSCR